MGQRQERAKDMRANDDQIEHRRHRHGLDQNVGEVPEFQLARDQGQHSHHEGPHACSFYWCKDTKIDTANGHQDHRDQRQRAHRGTKFFGHGGDRTSGAFLWLKERDADDHQNKERRQQQTRDNARNEQLADAFFRQDCIKHKARRRRDQDPQRTTCGHRASCQTVRIVETLHFWQRHLADGHSRRNGRPADRRKGCAAHDGRGREPAAEASDPSVCGLIKALRITRSPSHIAHQNKQWNDRQAIRSDRRIGL